MHVQDLVWQKWNKGKLGMMEDKRLNRGKEKKVTKTQSVLISARAARDSPWMMEEEEKAEQKNNVRLRREM